MGELAERRRGTQARISDLRGRLRTAETLTSGKASVYATGSFGRCEASQFSDLDLFIVGKCGGRPAKDGTQGSLLTRLDEICIKAELIRTTRAMGIPEFSGDGRYLTHHSVHSFTKSLGTPEDDVTNTFTARLLLLLESHPLLEPTVYEEVVREVVNAYWRDYEDHKSDFMPAFLSNDILRLWRTFCVNYEARTSRVPDEEKAKGKSKNYKLKHSRLLTCYSALLYLLAVFGQRETVTPDDAMSMIRLTPTGRLEWLLTQASLKNAHDFVRDLVRRYEIFLETTNCSEQELVSKFMDREKSQMFMKAAYEFGDVIFDAFAAIGEGNRFHRLLVV